VTLQNVKNDKRSGVEKAYMNTTIPADLVRSLRILAAHKEVRMNDVLTEAIRDLLKKYEKAAKKNKS